MFKIV